MAKHDITKTSFSQNLSDDFFFLILTEDVKLILDKFHVDICRRFRVIKKILHWIESDPPSVARINNLFSGNIIELLKYNIIKRASLRPFRWQPARKPDKSSKITPPRKPAARKGCPV